MAETEQKQNKPGETAFYTVKQVSERTNMPISTLRYYDKEGLTPQIKKTASGVRRYTQEDICWIELIGCLKNSGMPLEEIRKFMELCLLGESAAEDRKEVLLKQRERLACQLEQLQCSLNLIDYKLEHYREIGIFHLC